MKILKLKYRFSMSFAEIAERIGDKEANIRVYHSRALDKLYDELNEIYYPYQLAA
jgi:DNA-directed RNA polymerase specialized sigma24 family protein